jgi:hypothetical protein
MSKGLIFTQSPKVLRAKLVKLGITNKLLKNSPDIYTVINESNPSDFTVIAKPFTDTEGIPAKSGYFIDYLPLAECGGRYTLSDIVYYLKYQIQEYLQVNVQIAA